MERDGKTWFHQPRKFWLPAPWGSYTPDFYVVEDQCFYEILGTASSAQRSKGKRVAFRAKYPHLKLVELYIGAWKEGPRGPMKNPPPRAYDRLEEETKGWKSAKPTKPLAVELVRQAKALGIKSYTELGQYVGLPYSRLWTAINRPNPAAGHLVLALERLKERAARHA